MAEGRRKNTINLLFEAEVAPIHQHPVRDHVAQEERISLTSYIAKSLACAIDENRSMHSYRHGKSKLMVFDDVDLSVIVEREIKGGAPPVNYIARAANQKAAAESHVELQFAKTAAPG